MSHYDWASKELDLIYQSCTDEESKEMQKLMNDKLLEICALFATHGHSGYTSGYAIHCLNRLLDWKPLTSLTGSEDEWGPVSEREEGSTYQQNLRCSAVFRKNEDNSTAYYLFGKVFSNDGGETWFRNKNSSIPVTFPFAVPEKSERVILENTADKVE